MRRNLVCLLLAVSVLLISFINPAHKNAKIKKPLQDSSITLLEEYGAFVFKREKCESCHTLQDDSSTNKISLDGVGIKYPNTWHFWHFTEPALMVPGSTMPSFQHLQNTPIDALALQCIRAAARVSKENIQPENQRFLAQSQSIIDDLKTMKIDVTNLKGTEIIALIAYVQQIKTSEPKHFKDSVAAATFKIEYDKKQAFWDTVLKDKNSVLFGRLQSTSNDTIAMGKTLYNQNCIACHGSNGEGMVAPNLTDDYWLHGGDPVSIFKTIKDGVPEKGMKSWATDFTPTEVASIVVYIKSLRGKKTNNAKAPQGKRMSVIKR